MRNLKLEKTVKKIDRDIEALTIAAKYLSNTEEINEVKDSLNKKRQEVADELYKEDPHAYDNCRSKLREMVNIELDESKQKELLEEIREEFGRQNPNPSKQSSGLNAWLKELDVECEWIDKEECSWATLIITSIGMHRRNRI